LTPVKIALRVKERKCQFAVRFEQSSRWKVTHEPQFPQNFLMAV
jgi:hypothetical protein